MHSSSIEPERSRSTTGLNPESTVASVTDRSGWNKPGLADPQSGHELDSVKRHFAIRVEKDRLLLAVAEVLPGSPVQIEIDCQPLRDVETNEASPQDLTASVSDEVSQPSSILNDWLTGAGNQQLRSAISELMSRHQVGHAEVAVSLSGDFCVTRISTGTIEHVDEELEALASRIPRYLQLGPGGKLTGQARETLTPGIDHALTAVGNHTRLQTLYDALADCDIQVAWIEPSLVSMARLVGMLGIDQDKPILIADSFGQSWEVGIAHQGRLLLDYRPAAAYDSATFARAIDQHLARLRRFCQRHRGMAQSELDELYLGGPSEKLDPVIEYFRVDDSREGHALRTVALRLPDSFMSISVEAEHRSDSVAAVAAILPLIQPVVQQQPPDLLQTIRRDAAAPQWAWMVLTWWPTVAAALMLAALFVWESGLRSQAADKLQKRNYVENQIRATRSRMAALQSDRRWVEHLKTIDAKTTSPPMPELVRQITQCLPDRSALLSIRLETADTIHLSGTTTEESEIYEIVGYLRRLPNIDQVALLGTTVGSDEDESQFSIRLMWRPNTSIGSVALASQELPDA